jgi:thiol-disulfide isomerase/thioredoxin
MNTVKIPLVQHLWSTAAILSLIVLFSVPTEGWSVEFDSDRQESTLLHRRIALEKLQHWDGSTSSWIEADISKQDVTLVHIWALECIPCVSEMPYWRDIQIFFETNVTKAKLIFLVNAFDNKQLTNYILNHSKELPATSIYLPTSPELLRFVQGSKRLPLTLLLDRTGVVRYAKFGTIIRHRSELVLIIERLLATANVGSRQEAQCKN